MSHIAIHAGGCSYYLDLIGSIDTYGDSIMWLLNGLALRYYHHTVSQIHLLHRS